MFDPRNAGNAGINFERVIVQMKQKAVDSRGLKIWLYRGTSYTSEGFRDALKELTSAPFSADRVSYLNSDGSEDDRGEMTFARNLQLLTNCYVAALEYERAVRERA